MADDEQFSLCWNNFNSNLSAGFHESLCRGDLVDVTLAAEGQFVKAHRLVLSVCSPYFRRMFTQMPANQHAFVFLKDVSHSALKDLIQFMYCGEVNVKQDALPAFISTAEALQIKGLTDSEPAPSHSPAKPSTPAPQQTIPASTMTNVTTTSPRARSSNQRNRTSYKLESEDSGDENKPTNQLVLQSSQSHQQQQTLVQQQTQKRPAQRSITPQTVATVKRIKNSDPLEGTETTQITVQTVSDNKSNSGEAEFIDLPIDLPTKSEPDYTEDAGDVETAEQEATYVEDDSYGDMKYDESYFTENDETATVPTTSAATVKQSASFSESYVSDTGDQATTEAQERRHKRIRELMLAAQAKAHNNNIKEFFIKELNDLKDTIKQLNEELVKIRAENSVISKELIRRKDSTNEQFIRFPINTDDELEKIENDIPENEEEIVTVVRRLLLPEGIKRNLDKIIGLDIALNYNYDGIRGKCSFKTFRNLNDVLFKALQKEGYTQSDYKTDLKQSFKTYKNRHFKTVSILRQKTGRSRIKKVIFKKQIQRKATSAINKTNSGCVIFPINTTEELDMLENDIPGHEEDFITKVKRILLPEGLKKNLCKIIGMNLIINFNYDGIKGKSAFKDYKNLNAVLFKALLEDGYTEREYITELKLSFKAYKNRHFKNISVSKSKSISNRISSKVPNESTMERRNSTTGFVMFPANSTEELQILENCIAENEEEFITKVKSLILPEGIKRNLDKIIGLDIAINYNYDGMCGKHAFKNFKRLNDVLFQALLKDGYTELDFIKDMRHSFKAYKNRHFKHVSITKKKCAN